MSGAIDTAVDEICRRAADLHGDVEAVVESQIDLVAPLVSPGERAAIAAKSIARLDGLGVLDEYLRDDTVDEILVNAGREVVVERHGRLESVGELPAGAIDVILERVLAEHGRRLDRSSPVVDARLRDGSRLCAVVAPVAVDGTTVAIRRHRRRVFDLERFTTPEVSRVVRSIVAAHANVLVSGATSSGKTTLLAALCRATATSERLVVIEDTAELDVGDRHCVRLEARHASADGPAPVSPTDLVRTALRLRPDRLVVGEFRGDEVLAVVQALNTGHDGSLSTCHANGPVDALRRVETLVLQAAPSWPLAAIRRTVTRSLDAVVHVERAADGTRRIDRICEVIESGDEPAGRDLVRAGCVVGEFTRGRS